MKNKFIYHVFTDNKDEYVKTLKEARNIIKIWKAKGFENLRIYREEFDEEECIDENCVYSFGEWPY